jgi:flagellar basal body P-ring formation protein FlgA
MDGADCRHPRSSPIRQERCVSRPISALAALARARNLRSVDGRDARQREATMTIGRWLCSVAPLCLAATLALCSFTARGSDVAERVRVMLDERLAGTAGEIEVSVGEPDPRLKLAPCARMEPFVPSGARLIGRTSLGVRCMEGANWIVYVPVQVRLFLDAWVAARPIPRGVVIGAKDVRVDRVDVSALNGNAVLPDAPLIGRTALRPVAMGEPLRRDALRAPTVLQPGDAVQVVAIGTGFAAQTSGKALTAAADGQTAQVALAGGKVVSGVARVGGVVEVR